MARQEVFFLGFLGLAAAVLLLDTSSGRACTGGGAMKAATSDGRPIIWQNMDWSDHKVVLRKYEGTGGQHDVMEIVKHGASIGWNGLNSKGVAHTVNKLGDFGSNGNLGAVLKKIQRECSTISEFQQYLENRGAQTVGENFVVMDGTGRVVDFEIGPTYFYAYDPESSKRQQQSFFQSPKLFVARANNPFEDTDHQEPDATVDTWGYASSRFRYRTARDKFIERITNSDKLTVKEVLGIARWGNPGYDKHTISRPDAGSSGYSIWSTVMLGVKAGEDPRFATMLVSLGLPDYGIFIPVWVDLTQAELCEKVKTWDANNIAWWSYKLFEDRFDGTEDYDNYINGVFSELQGNILEAVRDAREQWLVKGNTARFHADAAILHDWSGWAAFRTVKSAYDTAGADGRSCNLPPKIASLNPVENGLTVTFSCDAVDPDGDGIAEYLWSFGDGTKTGATSDSTKTHTYAQPGTYLVGCYAKDGRASPAANVKFAYVTVSAAPAKDAGVPDSSGSPDASPADTGSPDGSSPDSVTTPDTGSPADSSMTPDAGSLPDTSMPDAGRALDASTSYRRRNADSDDLERPLVGGCAVSAAGGPPAAVALFGLLGLLAVVFGRRRRR